MSFYKGTQSDTFNIFRMKKRIGPKTRKRAKVMIVDESTSIFGYEKCSQALNKLKEEMWRKLSYVCRVVLLGTKKRCKQ